ncbi:MAG: hypothetical protein FWE98_01925 [Oscillospiraceae bacterium]|nr:hypothetical protein [Oscillospiraceae bacterium]
MIGLGTWKFLVDTMFYNGTAIIDIRDEGGEYAITATLPDLGGAPEVALKDVIEDGDTLSGIANTDLLQGKDIPCSLTFTGDKAEGLMKVPFIGKLKLKDGVKVA